MTTLFRNLLLTLMVALPLLLKGQCDVFIVPGSVQVSETEDAVMFTFDVTNNSSSNWMGDDIRMYWSLNSGANIMSIQYGDGSDLGHPSPLAPGQTQTFKTPWMAIPNLPSWFPDEQPSNDNPWLESMDWPYYTLPFPFNGTWSPINLRLASCGLADGAWVYDDTGELYYGPTGTSTCQDVNNDAFCDCDIAITGYDQDTHVVSLDVISSYNCGCNYITDNNNMDCYDSNTYDMNTGVEHLVFGLNVETLDENWLSCLTGNYHPGWAFGLITLFNNPLESGESISQEITLLGDCWETMLDFAPNSLCMQMVLWQINYSQTANVFTDYEGNPGWAETCGTCNKDTQDYPDIDIENNYIFWCFDEDPPDPDVPGCMDPTANNYDPDATEDDGSCMYDIPGCTDPVACNYDFNATVSDGSCIYCGPECIWENPNICEGCTDPEAANYNETAIYDDGSCEYPEVTDLSLDTLLYTTGCDEFGPYWSPQFYLTNEGTTPITEFCIVEDILGTWAPNDTTCFDNIVIQPGETYVQDWPNMYEWGVLSVRVIDVNGSSGVSWNDFGQDDDVGDNMYVQIITNAPECNYPDAKPTFNQLGYECIDDQVYVDANVIIQNWGEDTIFTYCISIPEIGYDQCFNGYIWPVYFIEPNAGQTFNLPPIPIDLDFIVITVYNVNGEPLDLQDNNVLQVDFTHSSNDLQCYDVEIYDYDADLFCDENGGYYVPTIMYENTGVETITELCVELDLYGTVYEEEVCWTGSADSGDFITITFPEVYVSSIGMYLDVVSINGELTNTAPEVITGVTQAWIEEADALCGCTIVQACNYDPNATYNDGTCDFETCEGCMDPEASNYDPDATINNPASCVYEIPGCTDVTAINYNPLANVDDGSCIEAVVGCMIPTALNYDPLANITCEPIIECCIFPVEGCTDETANNYNPAANVDDGSCEYDVTELTYVGAECNVDCDLSGPYYYVVTTWTNTGNVEITNFCAEWDVLGGPGDIQECYNGSLMPGDTVQLQFGPYNTNGSPVAWAYLQVINGVELVPQIENYETLYCYGDAQASCVYGCTDQDANNYDPTADVDDGSCTYDVFGCTDPSANNFNPDATIDDGSCAFDVLGCTDPSANNYNPLATVDDGSCQYNVLGCTDTSALNYNPFANIDDGSCLYYDPCDEQDIPVYVPNVFTPNGDGINDVWQIVTNSDCWLSWDVKIFNRWGNMIYEMDSPDQVWDGTVIGSDRIVSDGVYVCRIIARGKNARVFETTTDITVFK